jgi:hypothetical protein
MNEVNDESKEREEDSAVSAEPNDENPASFFCIPSRPSFNDGWSLN